MKIQRPLFTIALTMLVVDYAMNTMSGNIFYCSLALFALFIIVHKLTKDKYTANLILALATAVFSICFFIAFNNSLINTIEKIDKVDNTCIEGRIIDKGNTTSIGYYVIDADYINENKSDKIKVIVYNSDEFCIGQTLRITGKFRSFANKNNYSYYYSQGIYGSFDTEKIQIIDEKLSVSGLFADLCMKLIDKSREIFHYDVVPVAVAMGLGDKSLLDDDTVNAFGFTGASHTLVVSGLHVGFIVLILNVLLHYIPVNKKLKNIVLSVFILLFMALIGFTPSIIRAGVIIIAVTIGKNYFLEIDNYTILAVIIIITLLLNPYSACNISLLLSYMAYFGVIQAVEISDRNNYNKILASLLVTTFAVLYTSPITAAVGMDASLLSPLFNLALAPIVMVICVISFFLPIISFIPFISNLFVGLFSPINVICIRFMLSVTDFAKNNLSFAMLNMGQEKIRFVVYTTLIILFILFIQLDNSRIRKILIISVPILSLLCYNYLNKDIAVVQVFDGSSNPSYVISYNNKNYLVATENINRSTFKDALYDLKLDNFEEITYCGKAQPDTELYTQFTDNLVVIEQTGEYKSDIYSINAFIQNRKYGYVLDIGGAKIGFSHNKTKLDQYHADIYFFGKDAPDSVNADNYFYFYPAIKENIPLINSTNAIGLYDILKVKINLTDGRYYIRKDVINFGNRL